jgi:oligopeptidase B
VRGGSFVNYAWYEDGRLHNKLNTFKDFITVAEHLKVNKYCSDITIEGRSAGGLLVGACMVMRPDLFHNVIAGVPFLDVMNTMCDSSIPLTIEEWSQWGNPNVKSDFDYMIQYCPYSNIKRTDYPNMFITCGLWDPRVQYWEPHKFIAKLREYKTDDNIQIIKTTVNQGHFGGSSRYKYLKEVAEKYAFILEEDY